MENAYIAQTSELTAVADAIRAKGGTSEPLVFPDGFVTAIQSVESGTELNFEVVGGTTQPASPKENTIWINTDTNITGWSFGVEQPASPVSGMVWIQTAMTGSATFNALKENAVHIVLTGAMQYTKSGWSGSWSDKTAKIYQNGSWKSIEKAGILFKNGEQYSSITGGWINTYTGSGFTIGGFNEDSVGTSLVVRARSGSSNNYGGIVGTKSKVNLSGYKTMRVKGNVSSLHSTSFISIGLSSSTNLDISGSTVLAYFVLESAGNFEKTLSLPNSSSAYVFMSAVVFEATTTYTDTLTVNEIALE